MEAILASIRRIIAEDNIQPPPGMPPPAPPKPRQGLIEPSPVLLNRAPSPQDQPVSVEPATSRPATPAFQPVIVRSTNSPKPAASLIAPTTAAPSASPAPAAAPSVSASPAPSAVWGVLGDQHGAGQELVLTQMVAEDGSVVSFEKSQGRSAPSQAATPAPPKSEPLDVLLLTDALPGSLPDVAMPVTPPLNPTPDPAPVGPASFAAPASPAPPAAPVAAPRPPAAVEPDRARVGLASPETLVTSATVLEQLTRARSQPAGPVPNQASAPSAAPTLEDLVRQSLEPRIQEWLNAHLQEIVERLVQKEIDRISSRT